MSKSWQKESTPVEKIDEETVRFTTRATTVQEEEVIIKLSELKKQQLYFQKRVDDLNRQKQAAIDKFNSDIALVQQNLNLTVKNIQDAESMGVKEKPVPPATPPNSP